MLGLSRTVLYPLVLAGIILVIAVDTVWLFTAALPNVDRARTFNSASVSRDPTEAEEQRAILRDDRDYAIRTALGVAAVALVAGGLVVIGAETSKRKS